MCYTAFNRYVLRGAVVGTWRRSVSPMAYWGFDCRRELQLQAVVRCVVPAVWSKE